MTTPDTIIALDDPDPIVLFNPMEGLDYDTSKSATAPIKRRLITLVCRTCGCRLAGFDRALAKLKADGETWAASVGCDLCEKHVIIDVSPEDARQINAHREWLGNQTGQGSVYFLLFCLAGIAAIIAAIYELVTH